MRIITWNINSVRLRIGLIERLIEEQKPDIICLQETKTINDTFPQEALRLKGYVHQHIQGMKSYNGVAILSRLPLGPTGVHNWQGREDCRHIFATLPNGTELHCCYVPAGGDTPDVDLNDKFAHKLGFMDEQASWWSSRGDRHIPKILVGDLNVAPLENDVWSHKQMLGVVSHTPIEVEKYTAWKDSHAFVDAVRHFSRDDEKLFSWWSYRAADWVVSNRGRRLDHIWVTDDLPAELKAASILREVRGWGPKPSDHVPVMIDLGTQS